jgi:hypothetical protein
MIISDSDSAKLERFTCDAIDFLKTKTTNKYYADNMTVQGIELLDGTIRSIEEEGVFVLDNEFEAFIVSNLVKYVELLKENIDNPMFGLGERTLYEYVTGWLFLVVSGHVGEEHRSRAKTLLFAGFHKHVGSEQGGFERYMQQKSRYLNEKDIEKLDSFSFTEFNDYVWRVVNGIVGGYEIARRGTIDRLGGRLLYGHQSMRLHANPNAILELVSREDKSIRFRLVIAFNLRQAVEYYRGERGADQLIYRFDRFWKENKIREV